MSRCHSDVVHGQSRWHVACADLRFALAGFPDCSVDAVVCDPPYGLSREPDIADVMRHWINGDDYTHSGGGFMGKSWDSFVPGPSCWREVYRVMKPGAHLLAFAGTRTFDLMAISIRFAGFELRESLAWLHGQGFPKSLDVSKAIDAAAGAEREVIRARSYAMANAGGYSGGLNTNVPRSMSAEITAPATEAAAKWSGWHTALKPAHEPVIVARKPLDGTVAANVTKWGTGAINVDGCRIEGSYETRDLETSGGGSMFGLGAGGGAFVPASGRWPANVILSESQAAALDAMSGERPAGIAVTRNGGGRRIFNGENTDAVPVPDSGYRDSGGASRFFFCPKASTAEREMGLDHLPVRSGGELTGRTEGSAGQLNPRSGASFREGRRNTHPTVKPLELMRWLVRLVTPPGGLVLDPFTGSGTTGVATMLEGDGRRFVGCELDPYHVEIARARIAHVVGGGYERAVETEPQSSPRQVSLFGDVA